MQFAVLESSNSASLAHLKSWFLLCAQGNAGHTLITAAFARRLGLLDAAGRPKEARQRTVTVHGVVANAAERIPLMTLTYELRGDLLRLSAFYLLHLLASLHLAAGWALACNGY